MGLSEVNQVLTLNRLRHRVVLRTDGGIKTGRDVVIAAMLGAEEFGVGTAALVAMGCIMVRQCHSNTCPVGVCTQRPDLREKFEGTPDKVVNLFSFIAEEVREILASLGLRSLDEAIGRTDLLHQVSRGSPDLDDLDLNPILAQIDTGGHPRHCAIQGRNEVPDSLDARMIEDARAALLEGEKMQLAYNVRNAHRAVGTRLSAHITRRYGMDQLPPGQITVRLRGSAGQSLGAFAVQGLRLEVFGDANDYVGKGLSGGTIVVRPLVSSPMVANENVIIGNTCLYGATAGKLFAAGRAGERFAVRNSGALTVVEGCGDNGCEYMTGGVARDPRADRRQLRRRHERRHGLRLRPRRALRRAHQPGHGDPSADRGRALRGRAEGAAGAPRQEHPEPLRRAHPRGVRPRGRPLLADRAARDARQARGAGEPRGGGRAHRLRAPSPCDDKRGVSQRHHPVRRSVDGRRAATGGSTTVAWSSPSAGSLGRQVGRRLLGRRRHRPTPAVAPRPARRSREQQQQRCAQPDRTGREISAACHASDDLLFARQRTATTAALAKVCAFG